MSELGLRFDNTYVRLPRVFFEPARPMRVPEPRTIVWNGPLAEELGLTVTDPDTRAVACVVTGQTIPDGAEPIAMAYAGHQYGGFTMLGDGRAILLGEHLTPANNRVDWHFKGSGPTPYSRRGDGRAALGPMLREYIISEAMHALKIPTTRALAVATTGETVYRDTELPGAILTRIAASHLRVGTFQYIAAVNDQNNLCVLADYAIQRHDSDLIQNPQKYLEFLKRVIQRQAALIVQWQSIGFVHGVMNTDNMALSGQTIDYGPCAFMDAYDPGTVFSSIDHGGRYAYGNQPTIAQWNLARFAETLLPLISPDEETAIDQATEALSGFAERYRSLWLNAFRNKIGLVTEEAEDAALVNALLEILQVNAADFTNTFWKLSTEEITSNDSSEAGRFAAWRNRWTARLTREGRTLADAQRLMRTVNPAVIPRNHQVEAALAAAQEGDLAPLHRLVAVLRQPFSITSDSVEYQQPPPPTACGYRTFCGT